MKKQKRHFARQQADVQQASAPAAATAMEFSFDDPVPVLDRRELFDYMEGCLKLGKYYAPPVSLGDLAKTFRAAVHHSSPIFVKRNILLSTFVPGPKFSQQEFSQFALDYLIFGNAYIERQRALSGRPLKYTAPLAKFMRRGLVPGQFWFIQAGENDFEFPNGEVFQLREPDVNQEIYGMPEYLSALNSVWLNEASTLFRRKYYKNGSHAGFIFYMTDAAQSQEDVENLKKAFKDSKGPGNFKNLFLYAPNGKKDGVQLIPVSEVAAKDDFMNIKHVTRDDQLAAHRVPPQLMGIIPNNTGGFGDAEKAASVFSTNEIEPLQARMMQANEWAGEEIITFKPYTLAAGPAA